MNPRFDTLKQRFRAQRVGRYIRSLLPVVFLSCGLSPWILPALGQTAAGTQIRNSAVGSFEDPDNLGTVREVTSNEVVVTIAEVAGVTVTAAGTPTEAPSGVTGAGANQGNAAINPDDVVYFTFNITNVGNDPTQFFIPGGPSSVTNASFNATTIGPIQIIAYNPDGTSPTTLSTSVDVPTSGIATGATTALNLPNGSIKAGGSVTVRVPVKANASLNNGDTVTVVLGDTSASNRANQAYSDGGNNRDLYTQDNKDTDGITTEVAGVPINGDATNHRQEASASQDVTVAIASDPDLTLTKSHTGSFTVGSTGTYTFTITNSGTVSTSGTITVADTLPTGLTVNGGAAGAVTIGGADAANWTCTANAANPQVITCISSIAIAASGTSVFTLPVGVGANTAVGTNSITNTASVSGGGQVNTANDSASDPTTVVSPTYTISGTVFDDADGSKVKEGSEVLSTATGLNAVLVDATNKVVATTAVTSGAFSFSHVPASATYTVRITTATATVGSAPPAVTLPNGWVSTGENLNDTADATVDGILSVPVTTNNVTTANLGIEQLPTAVGDTATSQTNPGGTSTVTVPSTLFTGSTDPDGTVAAYKITTFPTNATSITINGTNYTSFSGGSLTVPAAQLAGMVVDPIDGAVTVGIPFQAIDNAGQLSSNTATASLPVSVSVSTRDYGDTPASYDSGTPASHLVPASPTVYLGTVPPDAEAGPSSPFDGTGDNTTGTNDEDGVTFAGGTTLNTGATASVSVVTQGTGVLYGWIDFNGNGTFESSERITNWGTGNASTGGTVTLTFGVPEGFTGTTYARFRYASDAAAANPTGNANNGEVEDYKITLAPRLTPATDSNGTPIAKGVCLAYPSTGVDQVVTAPAFAQGLTVQLWGAGGGHEVVGTGYAGAGGYTDAHFGSNMVTSGTQFTLVVGRGGVTNGRLGEFAPAPVYGFGAVAAHEQGGGLTGLFTGTTPVLETDQARALAIAGGGGGYENSGSEAGATGGNGNSTTSGGQNTMRGSTDNLTWGSLNVTVTAHLSSGGGGYQGGGRLPAPNPYSNIIGGDFANIASASGGSGFVAGTATSGRILSTPDGTGTPPNTSDSNYQTGIGIAGTLSQQRGGNGLAVLCWDVRDYGDAPASYNAGTPASHLLSATPTVYLGSVSPDGELGPTSNATATGDNTNDTNDEDALTTLPDVSPTGSYSLNSLPVKNTSGKTATLHAWIDFSKDGVLQASEYTSVSIPANAITANLNWASIPAGTTPGSTYARFRVTTDTLSDNAGTATIDERSIELATDGEVEDYQVAIAASTHTISGTVFQDDDGSNTKNGTEAIIPKVTVALYRDKNNDNILNATDDTNSDGVITIADAIATDPDTDANGNYSFTNLANGNYLVKIDLNDPDIATSIIAIGTPNPLAVDIAGADVIDQNFGFDPAYSISGKVFRDDNDNDIQNSTEPVLTDITVRLYQDINNNGVIDASDTLVATDTDNNSDGSYLFTNVLNGNYLMQVDTTDPNLPANATLGTPNPLDVTINGSNQSNQNFGFVPSTLSCGLIYGSYNNGSNVYNRLRTYTPSTSALSAELGTLTDGANGTPVIAALAVDPLLDSNGRRRIYYAENFNGNTRLFYYDGVSQTNTGIVLTLTALTNNVVRSDGTTATGNNTFNRMGFSPDGTLYIADSQKTFYRFTPNRSATGGTLSSAIPIQDNPNNDAGNSFRAQIGKSGGGDIAFDSSGRMYIVTYDANSSNVPTEFRLFQIIDPTGSSPQAVLLGKETSTDPVAGLAFQASDNKLYMQGSGGKTFSWNLATNTVGTLTTVTPGSADLGSCTYPDLDPNNAIQKTVTNITDPGATTLDANDILEYTISITNTGNLVAGNATLVDLIPSGSTYVPGTTKLNGASIADGASSTMPYTNSATPKQINTPNEASGVLLVGAANKATVSFRVKVTTSNTHICNQGTFKYDGGPATGILSDDPVTAGQAGDETCIGTVVSNPNVLLVKRITAINGQTTNPNDNTTVLNQFIEDSISNNEDNDSNWPNSYLLGAINAGLVKPGDEIEYTVYFLNAGGSPAENVTICDRIQPFQTFKFEAYGTGVDAQLEMGGGTVLELTAAADSTVDRAELVAAGISPPTICNITTNNNSTFVLDVTGTTGTPNLTTLPGSTAPATPNAYGFFRFTTIVDK